MAKFNDTFSLSCKIQLFKKSLYSFISREREREGEREGEKHQCVVRSHAPPTSDLARNPGMCPDLDLNQQPFGSQASTESTETHQPGPKYNYFYFSI